MKETLLLGAVLFCIGVFAATLVAVLAGAL